MLSIAGLALTGCLSKGQVGEAGGGSLDGGSTTLDGGSTTLDGASTSLDGAALYVSKGCVTCHGPLATSEKRNANFERIRAAAGPTSQVVPMRSIELTDDEIRALVVALADPSTPAAPDGRSPLVKPLLLTRSEVSSRLFSIFRGVDGAGVAGEEVVDLVERYVDEQASFFGGHCNRYDECNTTEISASQNPATSPVRAGLLVRTCLDLLAIDNMDRAVLAKVNLSPTDPVNPTNVRAVWDLFAPGRPIRDATVTEVVGVAAAAPAPAWPTVLQLFCRPTVLEAI